MPRSVLGSPALARPGDVDRINRVFSESFTERYQRDGLSGVRVPLLNPAIWHYAIATAGDGALIWRDAAGGIAAFNMVHRSGSEGWMGPLAVRPDLQHHGMGTAIVREGIRLLQAAGVSTIGLETMPRTVDNIGFYSRLGLRPGHLTVSVARELEGARGTGKGLRSDASRAELIGSCRRVAESLVPGLDFSREIDQTLGLELGGVTVVLERGEAAGFSLWHTAPLAEGRSREEGRVLKLAARNIQIFRKVIEATETDTRKAGARQLSVRCQTAFGDAYAFLIDRGYKVHWTDLRMSLAGHQEVTPGEGLLFSNWEI